jgi:uncharacterized membrane protein YeaQ/YmgE (transglycosylase-associated protein family)
VIFFAVLAVGLACGLLARVILGGPRRLSLSAIVVVGIAGSGIGFGIAELVGADAYWSRLLAAVAGSVAVLAIVRAAAARFRPESERGILQLIEGGESGTLEMKSTARVNLHTGKRDPRIELVIAKTVAGFMNAEGGTLLVGVADDGAIRGLDDDYATLSRATRDGFELWLADYLGDRLGRTALSALDVTFEAFDGKDVCRIDVARGERPVFLARPGGSRTADFYVRMGNATRQLLTDEALEYTESRFGR